MENLKDYAVSYIKESVINWINENDTSRNVLSFARKSGVPEASLRRFLNNNSMPNENNLRKIFFTLNPGKAWHEIMSSTDPKVAKYVRNTYAVLNINEQKNIVVLDENNVSVMNKSPIHTCVFALSSLDNGKGTSRDKIIEMFGDFGAVAIEDLIKAKLVQCTDNLVSNSKEIDNARFSPSESKIFVENLFSTFYKPDTNKNFLGFDLPPI